MRSRELGCRINIDPDRFRTIVVKGHSERHFVGRIQQVDGTGRAGKDFRPAGSVYVWDRVADSRCGVEEPVVPEPNVQFREFSVKQTNVVRMINFHVTVRLNVHSGLENPTWMKRNHQF